MSYPYYDSWELARQLIADASNVKSGTNTAYTSSNFLTFYPQFTDLLPTAVLDTFVTMANAAISQERFFEQWQFAMASYIAHYATKYLQATPSGVPTASSTVTAAGVQGLESSKSVGDVSVSYDLKTINDSISNWGDFATTTFGLQYINLARLTGMGGMYVW